MSDKELYYYANNEQVNLELEHAVIAFDLDEIKRPSRVFQNFVRQHAEQLRKSVYIVNRDDLPKEIAKIIEANQAERPVYRAGNTVVIVLPEVRVEDDSQGNLERLVSEWVKKNDSLACIKEDIRGRVVVEPVVKSGDDALRIASRLVEDLKIQSAQPRMIQKIQSPRPSAR